VKEFQFMECNRITPDLKRCNLPSGHPAQCYYDPAMAAQIAADSGREARRLIDSFQSGEVIIKRDPSCQKCKGRAYNALPKAVFVEGPQLSTVYEDGRISKNGEAYTAREIEHSICSGCGGYLYTYAKVRPSYATKQEVRDNPNRLSAPKRNGKTETPDLTAARIAEQKRRTVETPRKQSAPRNYMAEAAAQAARDVDAMTKWNGG
jgi:hypothetical protein